MAALIFILVRLLCTAVLPFPTTTDVRNYKIPEPGTCGRSDRNRISRRIAGGMKTAIDAYPWTALLGSRISRNSHEIQFFCGGSLISDHFVLTAAHCLYPVDDETQKVVRLGEWDIESAVDCDGGLCSEHHIDFDVEAYRLHESYDHSQYLNDIALIKLPYPVSLSPVCLPLSDDLQKQPKVGRILTVIGWGDTEKGKENPLYGSRYKKEANIPVIDSETCGKHFHRPISSSEFCAKNSTGSQSCRGDSGGPVVAEENDGYWYQYGIVSWGFSCGNETLNDEKLPLDVYARVSSFLPWIMETLGQLDYVNISNITVLP